LTFGVPTAAHEGLARMQPAMTKNEPIAVSSANDRRRQDRLILVVGPIISCVNTKNELYWSILRDCTWKTSLFPVSQVDNATHAEPGA
jgi:hypothetical protein